MSEITLKLSDRAKQLGIEKVVLGSRRVIVQVHGSEQLTIASTLPSKKSEWAKFIESIRKNITATLSPTFDNSKERKAQLRLIVSAITSLISEHYDYIFKPKPKPEQTVNEPDTEGAKKAPESDSGLESDSEDLEDESEEEGGGNIAAVLVELASTPPNTFFRDEDSTVYAKIDINGHFENVKVRGGKFKRYLSKLFYDATKSVARSDDLNSAIALLQAKTEFDAKSPTIVLNLRVAWGHDGSIHYDLTNPTWQSVKVTKDGWEIKEANETFGPVFVRYAQKEQVRPSRNFDSETFNKFMDLTNITKKDDKILFKVYLVTLFIPEISHAILQLHGGQGAAKTMLQTFAKEIADPSKGKLLSVHRDRMEFIMQMAHNHVASYDNLDIIPKWLSDEACRAATVAGSSKRMLYTDEEEVIFTYKRCLQFNGINLVLTKPDVIDRSIAIEVEIIPKKSRKGELKLLKQFEDMKPQLLGYIFDIISKSISIKNQLDQDKSLEGQLERMADFSLWGEAIARAMGEKAGEFLRIYGENREAQMHKVIEAFPVAQAIIAFMENKKEWRGSATELLRQLEAYTPELKINTSSSKEWPQGANALSRILNQIRTNLQGEGYQIGWGIDSKKHSRELIIKAIEQ